MSTDPQSVDAPGEPSSYNTCGQFPADEVRETFVPPPDPPVGP